MSEIIKTYDELSESQLRRTLTFAHLWSPT